MTAGRNGRGPLRIRRKGRHSAPTQVEKVAQQAGKAAPAVAIAGALVVAPQASHGLAASAKPVTTQSQATTASSTHTAAKAPGTTTRTVATLDAVTTSAVTVASATSAQGTTYQVQSGDTLSSLANEFFHNDDWQYLYHENDTTISDPNLIYVGQSLFIPSSAPASYSLSGYTPKHAKSAETADPTTQTTSSTSSSSSSSSTSSDNTSSSSDSSSDSQSTDGSSQSTSSVSTTDSATSVTSATAAAQPTSTGDYSCSGLEQLWDEAGGNSADAFMAAEIAMAESSGNPNAISPTDDYGLWQINIVNGSLATLNPLANAESAVTLSDDGTNWDPWTTYTSGAYEGQC